MSARPTLADARRVLRERFGLDEFRGLQAQAIEAVLCGRDALVTMPTGAGKSLVYQLPAVMLDGLVLVVSPLIALMKDQVDALGARGLRATFVNSSLSGAERERRLVAATRGHYDLLFVTPERFRSPRFRALLPELRIARMAVDEAHCISQWGHDFRPDYFKLGEYRALLGDPPTVALTATATARVATDIVTALRLADPLVVRTGIERPNLFLGCTRLDRPDDVLPLLRERLAAMDGAGIVYSTLIKDLERLHADLARQGVSSLVYHGKLSARERREMQERFLASDREIVLATNAFGMGIDKADIRFVLHAQMPRTLEAWTQEVGRAGRDGAPSWCELLFTEEDLAIQQTFIGWANPEREYLLGVYETLRAWGERIQTKELDDLRSELLVKNRADHRVSICLKWLEVLGVTEGSFETHDLRVARPLEPGELPELVGSEEKRRADLEGLLAMWRFANERETPRRTQLARHFDLEPPAPDPGPCDVTVDPARWRAEHLAPRPLRVAAREPAAAPAEERARPSSGPGEDAADAAALDPGFRRGDWVEVDGRHLGQVVSVEGEGRRVRLVVESAGDFRRRTVDPRKKRVRKLEDR